MQDPENSTSRKPWYQKAMQMATFWRSMTKSPAVSAPNTTLFKICSELPTKNSSVQRTISKSSEIATNSYRQKLRKCSSLKAATTFTRVCLCAPISSYNEVFQADIPPRRSYSYPMSKTLPATEERLLSTTRLSMERRRVIFRGKSLTDDVLMRRFVVEEEATMQLRRRNQIDVVRRRNMMRRRKLGPSRLSKMVLAEEEESITWENV